MLTAIVIAVLSVAAGTLLAFSRRAMALAAVQTFAVVAALGVVLVHLLPEALAGGGLATLAVFAVSWAVAHGLDRLSHGADADCVRWGLELGFAGLCLHKIGDGIALAHFARAPHWPGSGPSEPSFDVLFAIAAHSVPVAAMLVIAYLPRGVRPALLRAAVLAFAAVLGVLLFELFPADRLAAWQPWIAAATAGLLVHVVSHGWRGGHIDGWTARLADVFALAAGVALAAFGQGHPGDGGDVRAATGEALLELSLETAPVLLVGLLLAALLQTWGRRVPPRWLRGGRPLGQALRGALVGLPLPLCACGILPMAHSLRQRGAAPALIVAFLLATPELGVETFALSVRFFGWPFALLRLGAALFVAIVAALLVAFALRRSAAQDGPAPGAPTGGQTSWRFLLGQLDELLRHTLPWTAVGLLAAAYLQALLPADAFGAWGAGTDFLLVTLVAVPSYVCAVSATPLAAVLLAKGLSPGAILVGLLLGPATNLATAGWLRASFGTRAMLLALGGLVAATWALGGLTNAVDVPLRVSVGEGAQEHGPLAPWALGVLALLAGRGIWSEGLRGWLSALGEALGTPGAEPEAADAELHHGHGHGHGVR